MTSAIQALIEQRVSTNHFNTTRLVSEVQANSLSEVRSNRLPLELQDDAA